MLPSAINIPLVKNRQHPQQRVAGIGLDRTGQTGFRSRSCTSLRQPLFPLIFQNSVTTSNIDRVTLSIWPELSFYLPKGNNSFSLTTHGYTTKTRQSPSTAFIYLQSEFIPIVQKQVPLKQFLANNCYIVEQTPAWMLLQTLQS